MSGNVSAAVSLSNNAMFTLRDRDATIFWLRVAAKNGHAASASSLGMLLIREDDIDLRYEGVAYPMRAATMGDASAAELLGREFQRHGSDYAAVIDSAYWFRKAVDAGSATAYLSLSRQLAASTDEDSVVEAMAWAIVACRRAPLSTVHRTNACDWQMELRKRISNQGYVDATVMSERLLGGQ